MSTTVICPENYPKFECIGSACEDSCCIGWRVDLNKKTFHFYKQNQHKALVKLFKSSVKRNHAGKDDEHFGTIAMGSDGRCAFLDRENLCQIQRNLGPEALSSICATYPRRVNLVGNQLEYSLALSCPEAARILLLARTPMRFVEIRHDPGLPGGELAGQPSAAAQTGFPTRALRALTIRMLQFRELDIDTRLMFIGQLLESIENATGDEHVTILDQYTRLLEAPASIRQALHHIEANHELQLSFFGCMVGELTTAITGQRLTQCLIEATQGLSFADQEPQTDEDVIACYLRAQNSLYIPFLRDNGHILENYLVHHVFHNAFPGTSSNLLAFYREMVCNYVIVRMLLLGQAIIHKTLSEAIAIKTLQSFSRLSAHNDDYPTKIGKVCDDNELDDFRSLFELISMATETIPGKTG